MLNVRRRLLLSIAGAGLASAGASAQLLPSLPAIGGGAAGGVLGGVPVPG